MCPRDEGGALCAWKTPPVPMVGPVGHLPGLGSAPAAFTALGTGGVFGGGSFNQAKHHPGFRLIQ